MCTPLGNELLQGQPAIDEIVMLELARANAAASGVGNIEFVKGYIEDISLPDGSIDVVISNCVINLSANKRKVLADRLRAEARRTLRGLRRDRRPGHGRGHPCGYAGMDGLHSRCADKKRVRGCPRGLRPYRHRGQRDPPRPRARQLGDRARPQAAGLIPGDGRGPSRCRLSTAARTGALDATGYSVIVPVGPAIADATGAGPATIGLLVASFPAGMVAGFAVAGWVVRRFGPRWLLIASLGLVAVGALSFVVSNSLGVYFAARTIMGIGSGGIWIGVTFDTLGRWPGQEYDAHEPRVRGVPRPAG